MYLIFVLSIIATTYGEICPAYQGMNDTIRQMFLDTHNQLRALVASGKAEDGLGGTAPQAAAMHKLKYDCEVEKIAVAHAAKCQFQHSSSSSRKGYGENLYMRYPPYDKVQAAADGTKAWFAELKKFGVGQNLKLTMDIFNRGVGHYTQLVWQNTKAIGCAVQNCPQMSLVVCNYKDAGNTLNREIYEIGKPCSRCLLYDAKCDGGNLCIPK